MTWLVLLGEDELALDESYETLYQNPPTSDLRLTVPPLPSRKAYKVHVRSATRADLSQVLALQSECLPPSSQELSLGNLVNHLFHPELFCLVAAVQDQPNILLGCLTATMSSDRTSLYISTLCTVPAARRSGVARRLLGTALLPTQKELRLHVHVQNMAARSLYRSLGFLEIGWERNAYRNGCDTPGDALILSRI